MYLYRCRTCNEDVKLINLACVNCGPSKGIFQKASSQETHLVKCIGCGHLLDQKPLPDSCNSNHRGSLGWANETGWLQPDLTPTEALQDDVWLRGDFVGGFQGGPNIASQEIAQNDRRHYAISEVNQARLTNVSIVSGPPLNLNDREIPPLRFSAVAPIVVHTSKGDQEKTIPYSVTLADFRLHDWRELKIGEGSHFLSKKAFGVFSGTAYGVVRRDPELMPKKSVSPDAPKEPEVSPIAPPLINNQQNPPSPSRQGSTANPDTSPPPQTEEPTVTKPFIPCLICSPLLQAFLAGVIWFFCNWRHALVFFAVAYLACKLAEFTKERGWGIFSLPVRLIIYTLLALLVLFGILLEAYSLGFNQDCALISDWPIYLIGGALLLTAFVDYCWVRSLVLLIWFLTSLVWCSANGLQCNPERNITRFDILVHEIKINIENILNPDPNSIIVNEITDDPTNPENNRKISIEEVVKKPELLDICGNSIYFSDAALFPVNQSVIEPRAEVDLRKLATVVQRVPNRTLIITGHSDKLGDETDQGYLHNKELSFNRAQKVAEWLTTNAGVDASKIEVRGAGTSIPITTEENSRHLNRRVEVQLECPRQMTK
jgi:outer membrane protein OmpA-like peptidoglycan-associated protein